MAKKPEIKRTLSNLDTRSGPKKDKDKYHFQYWADGLNFDWDLDEDNFDSKSEYYMDKVMQLAALRRAAANFVRILTGDDQIKVVYNSGKDSYTDGQTVVISAEDDPTKFDKTVAIALHEASHCLLTDFNFATMALKMKPAEFFPKSIASATRPFYHVVEDASLIMNVIEDRRIDDFVYRTAVGYRPYYDVLYKEIWHSKEVSKALRIKKEWQIPSRTAYINRIINISNPVAWETRHLLPGMEEIYKIIDLPNIRRLNNDPADFRSFLEENGTMHRGKSQMRPAMDLIPDEWFDNGQLPSDRCLLPDWRPRGFQVALDVLAVMERYLSAPTPAKKKAPVKAPGRPDAADDADKSEDSGDMSNMDLDDLDMSMDGPELGGSADSTEADDASEDTDTDDSDDDTATQPGKKKRMTKAERDQTVNESKLDKEMEKIKDFINGESKKKKLERQIASDVEAMDSAEATLHEVGSDKIGRGRVLVTEKISEAILNAEWFPFVDRSYYTGEICGRALYEDAVAQGLRMGQILAHRLQVRNEQLVTKYPNQPSGHIDRRMLARLGMNIETVFSRKMEDKYRPALVHLSLDASGSMAGNKWTKTAALATALTYAASKISNLDVVISMRGGVRGDNGLAYMAIIHDSRKDTFPHFRRFFEKLSPSGSTPEGLCYEAIMEDILTESNDYSVYFVNVSDGEPAFTAMPAGSKTVQRRRRRYYASVNDTGAKAIHYNGETAWSHTRHQVNKMREAGIQVLSYFVNEGKSYNRQILATYGRTAGGPAHAFRTMYGEGAMFIDVTQVVGILNTMNKLLLKKV